VLLKLKLVVFLTTTFDPSNHLVIEIDEFCG